MEPRTRDERLDFQPPDGPSAREINQSRLSILVERNQALQEAFTAARQAAQDKRMVTVDVPMGRVTIYGE